MTGRDGYGAGLIQLVYLHFLQPLHKAVLILSRHEIALVKWQQIPINCPLMSWIKYPDYDSAQALHIDRHILCDVKRPALNL